MEEEAEAEKEAESIVSPYAITNLTNLKLLVKRLQSGETKSPEPHQRKKQGQPISHRHHHSASKQQESAKKLNRIYVISPGDTIDYEVDYEHQFRQQLNSNSAHAFTGDEGEFIKILFEDN